MLHCRRHALRMYIQANGTLVEDEAGRIPLPCYFTGTHSSALYRSWLKTPMHIYQLPVPLLDQVTPLPLLLVKMGNWLIGLIEKVCGGDVASRATWLLCSHRPNEVLCGGKISAVDGYILAVYDHLDRSCNASPLSPMVSGPMANISLRLHWLPHIRSEILDIK